MKRNLTFLLAIGLLTLASRSLAAEPLVGLWRLQQQEIDSQKSAFEPLTLQISQTGDKLSFAFSVPMPDIYFVTMSYTVRLDGLSADIMNGNAQKVGTIQMTGRAGQYKLTMRGPNKPDGQGKLTVSADGKTLTSESDATLQGRSIHSRQTFVRD